MAERAVKIESKTARLMQDAEGLATTIKKYEEERKQIVDSLLDICNEKDLDKITLDDGERQLLATIRITKDNKKWDSEQIKKLLPKELKDKVIKVKAKIVETEEIDYDAITDLFENGEIDTEDYLSMFATTKSQYVQVRRVAR